MSLYKTIKICDIEIPIFAGRIGISSSGGVDSTLLLYILMKELDSSQELFIYTFGQKLTYYSAISGSRTVLKKCAELTNFTNYTHFIDYDDIQNVNFLFRNPFRDLEDNKINALYTGITANPPLEVANSFLGPSANTEHLDRDPLVIRDIVNKDNICTPFTNLNKKDICRLYKELRINDTLYPYTRSCENLDPVYLGTHCKKCWWCKEREWGFGYC